VVATPDRDDARKIVRNRQIQTGSYAGPLACGDAEKCPVSVPDGEFSHPGGAITRRRRPVSERNGHAIRSSAAVKLAFQSPR
jgi:hypothetical protein